MQEPPVHEPVTIFPLHVAAVYLDDSGIPVVYARHGRTFKSVDLQSLWECYTWYEKNPNYSDDLLTETDKYNIELVQKFEAKK